MPLLTTLLTPPSFAQTSPDAARLSEIQERIRAYSDDASVRGAALTREGSVVRLLADAADAIPTSGTGTSYVRALDKIEEARRAALPEPALLEPVPSVLSEVRTLLNQPPPGSTTAQVKARVYAAVALLQEHLLEQAAVINNEAGYIQSIERSLSRSESALREAAVIGLRSTIYAEKLSIKR